MQYKEYREESPPLPLEDHRHYYLLSSSMYKSLSVKKKASRSHDLKGILKKLVEVVGLCEQMMDNKNEDASLLTDIESYGCCGKTSRYQRREVTSRNGAVDTRDYIRDFFDSKGKWNRYPRLPCNQRRKNETPSCSAASTNHATENLQLGSQYPASLDLPGEISTDENSFTADLCSDEEFAVSSPDEVDSSEYDADNEDTWDVSGRKEFTSKETCHKSEGCVRRLGLMIEGSNNTKPAKGIGLKLGTEFLGDRGKAGRTVLDGSSNGKQSNRIYAEYGIKVRDNFCKQQSTRKWHRRGKQTIRDMGKCIEFDRSNHDNHCSRVNAERCFMAKDSFIRQQVNGEGYEHGIESIMGRGEYAGNDESYHDNHYSRIDAEPDSLMGNFPRQQKIRTGMDRRKESFGVRGNRVDFERYKHYSHYSRGYAGSRDESISDYDADTEGVIQRSVIKKFPFIESPIDKKVYAIENKSTSLKTWDAHDDEAVFLDSRLLHVLRWRMALKRAFKAIDNVLAKLGLIGKRDSKPAAMLLGMRAETLEKLKLSEETIEIFEKSPIEEENNLERFLHL